MARTEMALTNPESGDGLEPQFDAVYRLLLGRAPLERLWGPRTVYDLLRGKPFEAWRRYPERSLHGMSAWRDLLDWVSGYRFEVGTPDEVIDFCRARGLVLCRLRTVGGRHGWSECNGYVFRRTQVERA